MQNGEKFNSTPDPNEENSTEFSRETSKKRGEATSKAELEALEKEYLEELAKLEQEKVKEESEIQALKQELDIDPDEIIQEADAATTFNKVKSKPNSNCKKLLRSTAAVALATAIFAAGFIATRESDKNPAPEPTPTSTTTEQDQDDTEVDQLRLSYDYTHWSDFENKSSRNAYDYDYSDCFNDIEKTKAGWYEVAERTPEALSSYVYYAFTDAEKADLGIANMSPVEIDNFMSDPDNQDAGAMQQKLLEALKNFMENDAEFVYYYENNTENSHYIYFVDENGDEIITPDEMHLGYSTVKRNGVAQVDVYRTINGKRVKVLDLNLYCGFQPNFEVPPADVPFIPGEEDPSTGSEGTGSEGTGSEGTGSEGTGSEGTGSEGTGSEGTGSESTGTESTGFEGTGNEGIELEAKDKAILIENATPDDESGLTVDVQELDEEKTPPTTLEEDEENFKAIEKQIQEDAEKAAEAERIRIEQEEAQRKAAEEAAERRRQEEEDELRRREEADRQAAEAANEAERQRLEEEERQRQSAEAERQRQADEAAARAAEEAAELQRQAAEAERQAAAEAEAARIAQEEADRQSAANAAEAESNANATAAERADMFNNGNF